MTAWLLSAPAILLLTLLVVLPSIQMLTMGFHSPDSSVYTLENFQTLLNSKFATQAFWRTIRVSLIATILTILGGYPIMYWLRHAGPRLTAIILTITIFPLMVSVVVRAFGWTVILGPSGILNRTMVGLGIISEPLILLNNEIAVIIGETHLLLPYMVLALVAVMQKVDPSLEEAAKSLGANPFVTFVRVTLPLSLPGLLSGTLLVFALAMTAFATPLLLGGGRTPLLTTLMYSYAYTLYDWNRAAAVALILVVLAIFFFSIQRFYAQIKMKSYE